MSVLQKALVATFQNGNICPSQAKNFSCEIFQDKSANIVAAVGSSNMVYTGKVEKDNLYNNFIVIRNKITGEVQYVPVENVILKPSLQNKKRQISDISLLNLNSSSINELSKQFGSKRAKRQTEQLERLKLNAENVKDLLQETVANVEVDEKDMVAPKVEENSIYRPPINREAQSIEDVYKLDTLIPDSVLLSLEQIVSQGLEGDDSAVAPAVFIKNELLKLKNVSTKEAKKKSKILLYVNALIKMLTTNSKEIAKQKFEVCNFSPEMNSHILDNFTQKTKSGRCRPTTLRDKTVCFVIVLSIIASDYKLNLEDLTQDIKIGMKKLQEFSKILSFSPQSSNKNIITLKLPLPPPILTHGSPKKRGRK